MTGDVDSILSAPAEHDEIGTCLSLRGMNFWLRQGADGTIRLLRRTSNMSSLEAMREPVEGEHLTEWSNDEAHREIIRLWGEERAGSEYHSLVWRLVATLLAQLAWEGPWRWALARAAIKKAADLDENLADAVGEDRAAQRLADRVGRSLERFGALVREPLLRTEYTEKTIAVLNRGKERHGSNPLRDLGMVGGFWRIVEQDLELGEVLWLDEVAAQWLEQEAHGRWGKDAAAGMRQAAKARATTWRDQLTLPGAERDAAALWRAWFAPDVEPVPVPFARDLALVLWLDEVGAEWARSERAELAGSKKGLAELTLFGEKRKPSTRVIMHGAEHEMYPLEGGGALLVEAPSISGSIVEGMQSEAGRFSIDLTDLRLLHYVALTLYEGMKAGVPWGELQRLRIPKGRNLAKELGMTSKGASSKKADSSVVKLSRVNLRDRRGNLVGLWGRPDEEAPAPGRSASFILPLRELVLPHELRRLEDYRVLVPLPDTLPNDAWLGPHLKADLARMAYAMAGAWRDRAGERHGALWLDRPGLPLSDEMWRKAGQGLNRDEVIERLTRDGWLATDGGLLLPGPLLPIMRSGLRRSAENAKARKSRHRKRRK